MFNRKLTLSPGINYNFYQTISYVNSQENKSSSNSFTPNLNIEYRLDSLEIERHTLRALHFLEEKTAALCRQPITYAEMNETYNNQQTCIKLPTTLPMHGYRLSPFQ